MRTHTRIVSFDPCPEDPHRPVATPIYQTATFDQESAAGFGRYDYSRSGNPTREVLERHLAKLEGGLRSFAFASGLAALAATARLLKPGDEILACDDLYGGTYRLFSRILSERGISVRYADLTDLSATEAAIGPSTKLVHIEPLSNPLLRVFDVRALAEIAHRHGALLSADATSLSPYLIRPLDLGADIVIQSATKHLCGHSDVTAGVLTVRDQVLAERIYFIQNGEGAVLGPFDAFLLLRGIKTLGVRLDRQQQTALRVAQALAALPGVHRVRFPGLEGHDRAAIHAAQADGPGTLVCFETGDFETSLRLVEALKLFNITVSFGGVNSSASLPCRMSHASIPAPVRAARALPEDLVRLSIGLEDAEDLVEDLGAALALAVQHPPKNAEMKSLRSSGSTTSSALKSALEHGGAVLK